VKTNYGTQVHIPHRDYTDNRVVWLSPRQYYGVYKDTFDYLHANEPMSFEVMTVHCHFGGLPPGAWSHPPCAGPRITWGTRRAPVTGLAGRPFAIIQSRRVP